jgi:RimJ/RimL family protein N-acetyltransferase
MKVELKKLTIRYLFDFMRTIKNPEVGSKLQFNVPGYLLKGLKEIWGDLGGSYKWAILVDGKYAGDVVLEDFNKDKTECEIGYYVAREFWGKGIATKAVKEILKFAFKDLKLKKVKADNDLDNPASGKVLKNAGFKKMKTDKKKQIVLWEKKRW